MEHGTDPGYYEHRMKGVPFPEDEGQPTCGCRLAHARRERERATHRETKQRQRARGPEPRVNTCPCGTPITRRAVHCRSCAAKAQPAPEPAPEPPIRWVRQGLIWRAA